MKRLSMYLACILIALTCLAPLSAQASIPQKKKVRVGWYESAFHRTDEFGRRSGYGYEYQQRIATFTGWEYEYVEGSWSELLEMLMAGEIDLLSDVSYTPERAEKILYSSQRMGSEDYHTFISPSNTEIRPDDFTTFNGKLVGVNKNSIQAKLFTEWARSHGLSPDVVELSVKTPEMLEMLANGEIDVLVTLDAYGKTADVVPVCKIGSADSFFGINLNRPDIKQELDTAMSRLLEENRYFDQQLAAKYNSSDGFLNFLTPEEKNWFNAHGPIRVGYRKDYLPFCGQDKSSGRLTGALADFLTFAETCEKNAQLGFTTQAYDTYEAGMKALANGEIDCLFPVSLSPYDGEQMGVIITDAFVETEMYVAVRTADRQGVSPDREMTIALISGNPNFESFLMDYFPSWKTKYYDDVPSGFQAVGSGAVDGVLVSNYRLSRLGELSLRNDLSALTTGKMMSLAFAVRREDDRLYSILNKTSQLMSDAHINAALTDYSFHDDRVTVEEFLRDNMYLVLGIVAGIALIIILLLLWTIRTQNRANKERELISAVELDSLTRLYNRNFFFEYANRIHRRSPEPEMDAIVINIEQFHSVNELNGREFGDHVLQILGEEIRAFLNETDGIGARFDADRFDIFCRPQQDYQALLNRFQSKVNQVAHNATINLRMGVTPWQKGTDPVLQFDRARTACNKVRGSEKHLMVYDNELQKQEQLNQRLINDLGKGIQEHEFKVFYQPKYSIQNGAPKLASVEALIRWQHPELGLIPPDAFIPLFERNGQIREIDKYVWNEAAKQIDTWKQKYGIALPVSVNLSRVDALDPNLEQTLDDLVAKYKLERKFLNLEITESAYTENADQLRDTIYRLREKGFVIEMDDFGSGYSSLNMLSSMPIDVLKMDRAFIQNIEHSEKDFRLVELILDIARSLHVPVIAEGVETEAQMLMLKNAGCALVQGFYFSRPLPPDDFEKKVLGKRSA